MFLTNFNGGKNMPDEEKKYYESEAKRKWQKENTVLVGIKLQKKGDKELIDYIEMKKKEYPDKSAASVFKDALKEKMIQEQKH